MFDFSWSEMFIVAVVGLLVIGPDELPAVIRKCKNALVKLKNMAGEFTSAITDVDAVGDLKNEARKINDEIKTIIDLDGNIQPTYDISDVMDDINKNKKPHPPENST